VRRRRRIITKESIPNQPETRAFKDLELPEGEIVGEDTESILRARNLYIKPRKRPLYTLQVECLIIISRALHLYKEQTSLTYNFQDSEDKGTYWSFTLPTTVPRPIGFNLREYTWLEIARYLRPRLQNWIKAGGFHLYQRNKRNIETEELAEPFFIDLWGIIEEKETRILDWYRPRFKDVSQQETNKESGQKRKCSSITRTTNA
jgi:hypothetical protein